MEQSNNKPKKKFSRRKFLIRAGSGLMGTMALLYFARSPIRRGLSGAVGDLEISSDVSNLEPTLWFQINPDNTITLKSPKVEMGQGIFTGFAMLAAEELDVELEQIKVVHASSLNGLLSNTGVSNSTSSLYEDIRKVAATLRETLKLEASKLWKTDPAFISTKGGMLSISGQSMSYADLAKTTTKWEIAKTPALRPASSFKYVGTGQKRIDVLDKVLAKPIYGIDTTLPNMVYGAVLYSPYFNGKLKSADTDEAKTMNGVITILQDKEWIGVVADTRPNAEKALAKVKAVWDYNSNYNTDDCIKAVTVGNGTEVNIQRSGDTVDAPGDEITSEFRTPIGFHACMEPSIVVADFDGDKVTLHASYQNLPFLQSSVADALGIDPGKVHIISTYLGGGFGRKSFKHNAVEAAKLSQAAGKPVHLLYTRQQEFQNGFVRPNTHHVLKGKVSKGKIMAMELELATAPMSFMALPAIAGTILGADFIVAGSGERISYDIPNVKATMWHIDVPFETCVWRGVGMFANTFAMESFMDMLAHRAGVDPLEFRINHCGDTGQLLRRKKILELIGEKSGWHDTQPAGIGRGLAVCDDHKTLCGAVATVKIENGQIRVIKVLQAIDPGKIINPEGIKQQVEGATMMAISASLYEQGTIEGGQFADTNFHSYKVATLKDTPDIEVLLHEGSEKPTGVGEPPVSTVAAAIANAVFNLTGVRLRSLPLQQAFEKEKPIT